MEFSRGVAAKFKELSRALVRLSNLRSFTVFKEVWEPGI
jgi:hypothetical protein